MSIFTQFDRKQEEEEGYDHWSDHASDVDESSLVPDHLKHFPPQPEYHEIDVSDTITWTPLQVSICLRC
jgi:hypothetical protein